jgi:hypothetical protein
LNTNKPVTRIFAELDKVTLMPRDVFELLRKITSGPRSVKD